MSGNWPDEDAKKMGGEIDRDTYQWLLLIQKQNQLGIHISTDVAAQAAKAMMSQFQRAGINSPEMFIRQVLQPRGFQLDDLERFVRHYMGVQELIGTFGLGGKLVTPQEIRDLYKREHEEVANRSRVLLRLELPGRRAPCRPTRSRNSIPIGWRPIASPTACRSAMSGLTSPISWRRPTRSWPG